MDRRRQELWNQHQQERTRLDVHDPRFFLLLVLTPDLEDRKEQGPTQRTFPNRRFYLYDLVAYVEGRQCNFFDVPAGRDFDRDAPWPALCQQEINRSLCYIGYNWISRLAIYLRDFWTPGRSHRP